MVEFFAPLNSTDWNSDRTDRKVDQILVVGRQTEAGRRTDGRTNGRTEGRTDRQTHGIGSRIQPCIWTNSKLSCCWVPSLKTSRCGFITCSRNYFTPAHTRINSPSELISVLSYLYYSDYHSSCWRLDSIQFNYVWRVLCDRKKERCREQSRHEDTETGAWKFSKKRAGWGIQWSSRNFLLDVGIHIDVIGSAHILWFHSFNDFL